MPFLNIIGQLDLRRLFLLVWWVGFCGVLHSEGVLRVCVSDHRGESLPGVTAVVEGAVSLSLVTDSAGCLSAGLPVSNVYRLVLSAMGYHTMDTVLVLNGDHTLAVSLKPLEQWVDEVTVSGNKRADGRQIVVGDDEMGTRGRGFGERDVLAILQQHAGVAHASEVSPGIFVRGMDNGYTGIYYAGCELPGVQHMLSIYPQFNSDAIGQVCLLKGDFTPRYGGYLASYLMVEPDKERPERLSGSAEVGVLTSKVLVKFPFSRQVWNKMSFRRSYFDLVANGYNHYRSANQDQLPLYGFYDFSNTLVIADGEKGHCSVDLFLSGDDIRFDDRQVNFSANWNNALVAANWNRQLSAASHLDVTAGYMRFALDADFSTLMGRVIANRMEQFSFAATMSGDVSSALVFAGGLDVRSGRIDIDGTATDVLYEHIEPVTWGSSSFHGAAFGQLQWAMGASWLMKTGLRGEWFCVDTTFLHLLPYWSLLGRWGQYDVHASYSRQAQHKHLFVPTAIHLPFNIWCPATADLYPEEAHHLNLGAVAALAKGVDVSFSLFYIRLHNATEFINGNYFTSLNFEAQKGTGESGGLEYLVHYQDKRIDASLSYTWSQSRRKFASINEGEWFRPAYDVPHKIDFNLVVRPFEHWTFTLSQFFQSGQMTTLPTSIYLHQKADGVSGGDVQIVPVYTSRNNYRMPWSHRLDVSATVDMQGAKVRSALTFGVYNVYNYQNPYFIYFESSRQDDLRSFLEAKKKSLLPFVPFLNYRIEF